MNWWHQLSSWWLILVLGATSAAAIRPAASLQIDPGASGWVDAHGPAASALAAVEERFGRQDGFLIALFAPDILTPESIAWQRAVSKVVAALPGVAAVDSLPTAQDVVVDDLGPSSTPLVREPRERILNHPLYRDLLVSRDGTAAGLLVRLDRNVDDQASLVLECHLRELLQTQPPPAGTEAVLGGLPAQQHAIGRAVARDQSLIVPLIGLLLIVVLTGVLPSWRLVAATVCGVASALVWTFACIAMAGRQLDALLGLLPPLVLGIGVATAMHVTRALAQAVVAGEPAPRRAAWDRLRTPLTLATVKALAGVGGLWLGAVPAVLSFAPWAVLAVVVGTLCPLLWLLAIVPVVTREEWTRVATGRWGDRLGARLSQLALWAAARRWWMGGGALLLTIVASVLCTRLRADADFLHALPPTDVVRQAHERIDRDLTGTLGLDLLVDVGHPPTTSDLHAITTLGNQVRLLPTVAAAVSLGDIVALVRERGDRRDSVDVLGDLHLGAPAVVRRFLGPGQGGASAATTLRLMVRQRDGSVAEAARDARRIKADAAMLFPLARITVASAALLLDETTARLVPATAQGLAASKISVALLLLVVLRRWRLALMALILAGFPLLLTYAAIPLLGWPLDIGVSMIACIALGLVMNDTVHLVDALHHYGLSAGYRRVGPSVMLAGIVLALAFSACDMGTFAYTKRFGVLLACAFASGVAVNCLLAPALAWCLPPPQESRA